jgi:hypothetical protein
MFSLACEDVVAARLLYPAAFSGHQLRREIEIERGGERERTVTLIGTLTFVSAERGANATSCCTDF